MNNQSINQSIFQSLLLIARADIELPTYTVMKICLLLVLFLVGTLAETIDKNDVIAFFTEMDKDDDKEISIHGR